MNSFSPDFSVWRITVGLEFVHVCFLSWFPGEAEDSVLGAGGHEPLLGQEQDCLMAQPLIVRDPEAVAEMRLF